MNPRNLLSGLIGVIIGTLSTYFVMEHIHDKELNTLYAELNEAEEGADELVQAYSGTSTLDRVSKASVITGDKIITNNLHLVIAAEKEADEDYSTVPPLRGIVNLPVDDAAPELTGTIIFEGGRRFLVEPDGQRIEMPDGDLEFEEDEEVEEGEGDEEEVDPSNNTFNGIYIIPNDQVSGSQVVLTFNHDDNSAEVVKMMSVPSESFDDIIESDALYTLINEEAFGILKRSRARSKDKDPRLICVRNNVINLDFVISY